jgi:uncharacterized membrane protein YsdA (DUF1294 family)
MYKIKNGCFQKPSSEKRRCAMTFLGNFLLVYLGICCLLAFVLCGIDKSRARRGRWRIPERTLFTVSALGGAGGFLLGMLLFRHKTQHLSFRIGVPLLVAFWLILLVLLQMRWGLLF